MAFVVTGPDVMPRPVEERLERRPRLRGPSPSSLLTAP